MPKTKSNMKHILFIFSLTYITFFSASAQESVGIDVSHHQGVINWKDVAHENIAFVYVKATEGATYTDPRFHENMKGAIDAGLATGAYHYFRMTSGATEQFKNFKKALSEYKFQLVPMIDVETSDEKPVKELQDSLDVFIKLLKEEYGCPPMIYGTQSSYNTFCAPKYNRYHLYIGRYGSNSPEIKGPGTYTIWQYTESGKIKGINKHVDICRFNPKYTIKNIYR